MIGSEKKTKRHMEKEGLEAERRAKDKKHSHKRQKMNKKNLQRRTSSSPRSDFSQSDDSDEEMAVCPAERCQLPEGDEVRKASINSLTYRFSRGSHYVNVNLDNKYQVTFIKFSKRGIWTLSM